MSLGVHTNINSLSAQRSLAGTQKLMETAMERLSTGQRINSAGDDAAGLAMASRLSTQVKGLDMAVKNARDGQSMVQALESGLQEIDDILQRMKELAVQSANGTLRSTDRTYIGDEATALIAEIDRIQTDTKFNGIALFDGNLSTSLQVGANSGETISLTQASVASGSLGAFTISDGPSALDAAGTTIPANNVTTNEDLTITNTATSASGTTTAAAGDSAKATAVSVNALTATTGVEATAKTLASISFSAAATVDLEINGTGIVATAVTTNGYSGLVDAINNISGTTGVTAKVETGGTRVILTDADGDDITLVRTDSTASNMAVNALETDESQSAITDGTVHGASDATNNDSIRIQGHVVFTSSDDFTVASGGTATNGYVDSASNTATANALSSVDLSSITAASTAMATIDGAIEKIADMRSALGAIDNRLDHTQSNLLTVSEATSAARSKILDADYAKESAALAKAQVLMQAGTAMLAQANAEPHLVLQLLQ